MARTICLDRRRLFVLCSHLLDGAAQMSADARPFRFEKKGNRRDSKQAGVANAAGTKGWRPFVEIRLETRSGRERTFFSCSRHALLAPTPSS